MEFENQYVRYAIVEEVLYITYKGPSRMTSDIAKLIYEVRMDFLKGRQLPAIVRNNGVKFIPRQTRKYLNDHLPDGITQLAIVVDSPLQEFITRLLMKLMAVSVPYKVFTTENRAKLWIRAGGIIAA